MEEFLLYQHIQFQDWFFSFTIETVEDVTRETIDFTVLDLCSFFFKAVNTWISYASRTNVIKITPPISTAVIALIRYCPGKANGASSTYNCNRKTQQFQNLLFFHFQASIIIFNYYTTGRILETVWELLGRYDIRAWQILHWGFPVSSSWICIQNLLHQHRSGAFQSLSQLFRILVCSKVYFCCDSSSRSFKIGNHGIWGQISHQTSLLIPGPARP